MLFNFHTNVVKTCFLFGGASLRQIEITSFSILADVTGTPYFWIFDILNYLLAGQGDAVRLAEAEDTSQIYKEIDKGTQRFSSLFIYFFYLRFYI